MKKIAFVIISFLCFMHGATAQDTLLSATPKESYFYNQWFTRDTLMPYSAGPLVSDYIEEAYAFHTEDSLQIHGLAVSLSFYRKTKRNVTYLDTTIDKVYRSIRLYVPSGDSLRMLGERKLYMRDSASMDYYFQLNKYDMTAPGMLMSPIPVYECYFDQPVTVKDTFYIGFNFENNWTKDSVDTVSMRHITIHNQLYSAELYGFSQLSGMEGENTTIAMRRSLNNPHLNEGAWFFYTFTTPQPKFFFYAITEPQDSTSTGGGSDTTQSIQKNMLERYTHVFPNPATERVQVLSSFGLTHLEAYDADGRRVAEREASGLEATLDVTAWPRGTYLLRITTPVGTVTKKLLVQ